MASPEETFICSSQRAHIGKPLAAMRVMFTSANDRKRALFSSSIASSLRFFSCGSVSSPSSPASAYM
eukprot:1631406-Pleurochrysis_carterae.AAC.1